MNAVEIIDRLGLRPHPEGGHYREVYRHVPSGGGRGDLTVIYFLLAAGECSVWHRIDATEVWHYHAGDPLRLGVWEEGGEILSATLGTDLAAGESPQLIVPPHAWQTARSLGAWTLVGCTVAPAFQFDGFEIAPDGWSPETGAS